MSKRLIIIGMSLMLFLSAGSILIWNQADAFSQTVLQQGAKGDEVRELQGRLQFLGFYHGQIDGDYGVHTRDSVYTFQNQFGLKIDGKAGPETKNKLKQATAAWKPGQGSAQQGQQGNQNPAPSQAASAMGFSQNDIQLMANAVYGEARGEPYEGQVAVAAVILNRVQSDTFPNTVSGVIFEPRAFTAVADGQIWLEPNETATRAVMDAINGMDPSNGCIYYFNPDTATSPWIWTRQQVKTIGKHIFCI